MPSITDHRAHIPNPKKQYPVLDLSNEEDIPKTSILPPTPAVGEKICTQMQPPVPNDSFDKLKRNREKNSNPKTDMSSNQEQQKKKPSKKKQRTEVIIIEKILAQ